MAETPSTGDNQISDVPKSSDILDINGYKVNRTKYELDREDALTTRDKEYLKQAGEQVLDKFLEDFPNDLPDIIILPDRSARPLMYLMKPVIDMVAQQRGLTKKPAFVFFQPIRYDVSDIHSLEEEVKDLSQNLSSAYSKKSPNQEAIQKIKTALAERETRLSSQKALLAQLTIEADGVHKQRAEELRAYAQKNLHTDRPTFAIFDDYVSKEASSVKSIRRALGRRRPDGQLEGYNTRAYAFFGEDPSHNPEGVVIGMKDPYPPVHGRTFTITAPGPDYTNEHLGRFDRRTGVLTAALGVEKSRSEQELHVHKAENSTYKARHELRSGMHEVGAELTKVLEPQEKTRIEQRQKLRSPRQKLADFARGIFRK